MFEATTLLLCQPQTGLAPAARLTWIECALATQAKAPHKIAVFPELFLSGYAASVDDPAQAAMQDRESLIRVQQLCARHGTWCVVGLTLSDTLGYRNSAVCIDEEGVIRAIHHKCRPFGEAERKAFSPGEKPSLIDTPLGRTGIAICFDIEDAALIADYRAQGAEAILTPTANMLPYVLVPEVKVRARALDNGLLIAYANYTGKEAEFDFPGDSVVIDSQGVIQGKLGRLPGVLTLCL